MHQKLSQAGRGVGATAHMTSLKYRGMNSSIVGLAYNSKRIQPCSISPVGIRLLLKKLAKQQDS
jgi:hypothetical protein